MHSSAMLLLAAIAAADAPAAALKVEAAATVRIERGLRVNPETWRRIPPSSRTEKLTRDEQGRPRILRLVENQ